MKVLLTSCDEFNFGRITTLPLDLPEGCSVDYLKAEAASKQGLMSRNLRLCVNYMGVLLAEGQICSFYGIAEGSCVHQEILGRAEANRKTELVHNDKYLRKLGFGEALPVIEERPVNLLEQIIKLCKAGNLNELIALCESLEQHQDNFCEDGEDEFIANRSDRDGWTCYHYAAFQGHPRIIAYLRSKGCNPNKESKDAWTPLQLACYQGQLECAKELVKHPSIQINRLTSRGAALHQACFKNHESLVQLLLENDACLTQEDGKGRIPLEMTSNMAILEMIPRCMGQRQLDAIKQAEKTEEPEKIQVPAPFCGVVYYSQPLTINDKKVYLVLDPGVGTLSRYLSQQSFVENQSPTCTYRLTDIQTVSQSQKSGFGKRKFWFCVELRNQKMKFACTYNEVATEWTERISEAVNYCQVHRIGLSDVKSSFGFRSITDPAMPESDEEQKTLKNTHGSASSSSMMEDEPPTPTTLQVNLAPVNFSSFQIIEELGSGSFGKVYKARKLSDGTIYAMKSLSKQFLMKQKQLRYAVSECKILKSMNHPYVIRLFHAFQTPKNLYMVLEYCPNGDLAAHLTERGTFDEVDARIYIAETLLAIEYLHDQDIVYRDLKPENILLDRKGHIRLADFGLAKEGVVGANSTKSFCGSPAYIAPEVLTQQGAGKPADVYGLGAILFEMLSGQPPFYSDDARELMSNIKRQTKLTFPEHISIEAKEFIKLVLNKDPMKRPTIKKLKNHPFFKKVNWDLLLQQKVDPPILGAGWVQGSDAEDQDQKESIYPLRVVDKDYAGEASMEECVVDFDQ